MLRTRAKKAVCLITSWVSDRPFSLPYVSLRVAVPRGVSGAPNTIFASDSASLAPQSRRAHGRGRGVGGLGTQPVMTTCLAHTRGVARPPSAWKRARDDASHAPGGVGAASRRRPLFHDTARGGVPCPGGWHAKPSRAKGRGSRPSPASMLMSLLTSNVDAGDDGASSSSLSGEASGSVASSASGPGSPVKSRIPRTAWRRIPSCARSRASPCARSRSAAIGRPGNVRTW